MTVEIRTQTVKPVRQTFGHLARRFGDKPATRYQEATYDIQSEVNHHYKPLWDPSVTSTTSGAPPSRWPTGTR